MSDLRVTTPSTTIPTSTGILFGADSESASNPSVYTAAVVAQLAEAGGVARLGVLAKTARAASGGLSSADVGQVVVTSDSTAATMTIANPIPAGFHCTIIQGGAGQVTLAGDGTTTVVNADSTLRTAKQWAAVSLYADATNHIVVGGYVG